MFLLLFSTFFLLFSEVPGELLQSRKNYFEAKKCDPNCTFVYNYTNSETIKYFPTECSVVCADIYIFAGSGLSEEQLKTTFKNMKKLFGTLELQQTNFTNVTFLAGLEAVETDYGDIRILYNWNLTEVDFSNLTSVNCSAFRIASNPKMKTIKLPNLKNLSSSEVSSFAPIPRMVMLIAGLSPEYCMKFDEMEHFLSLDKGDFSSIYANYCTPTPEEKICRTLQPGCTRMLGDLRIDSSFNDLYSIKTLESLFGRLIVTGTNLTSLESLPNLKYIAPLGWNSGDSYFGYENDLSKAFQLLNNSKLINYTLPNLIRIRSDGHNQTVIQSNNEELLVDSKSCWKLEAALINHFVRVDGKYCYDIQSNEDRRNEETRTLIMWIAIGVGGAAFLIISVLLCYCCCLKKKRT